MNLRKSITFTPDNCRQLEEKAAESHRSQNEIVNEALRLYFSEYDLAAAVRQAANEICQVDREVIVAALDEKSNKILEEIAKLHQNAPK